jgi:uncharacterized protein
MATKTKKTKKAKSAAVPPSIIWFEIPADDVARAKTFYSKLFGWKIKKFPGPMEYWHIDTGGSDDSPDGGMMKRQDPKQTITNYINVASVDKYMEKVQKLGGKVCMGKTAVPEMGFFAICLDPEHNAFAIWERIGTAK